MNLCVLWNAGNFLTDWATTSSLGRTLLYVMSCNIDCCRCRPWETHSIYMYVVGVSRDLLDGILFLSEKPSTKHWYNTLLAERLIRIISTSCQPSECYVVHSHWTKFDARSFKKSVNVRACSERIYLCGKSDLYSTIFIWDDFHMYWFFCDFSSTSFNSEHVSKDMKLLPYGKEARFRWFIFSVTLNEFHKMQ